MSFNGSLDFLNMIRTPQNMATTVENRPVQRVSVKKTQAEEAHTLSDSVDVIAVIDTETNWHDKVMSLGVALADASTFRCIGKRYYVFDPECRVGGMYSYVMNKCDVDPVTCSRADALQDLSDFFAKEGVSRIFAYNAKFDLGHLPEMASFQWYDIMRLAAYRQYNRAIPDSAVCCKSGRLKTGYGVEPIMRMLSGNMRYSEVHNAVTDACDELKIMELLGQDLETYECSRI